MRRLTFGRRGEAVERRHAPDDRRADRPRDDAQEHRPHPVSEYTVTITRELNTAVKSTQTETAKDGKMLLTPWMR